MNVRCITVFVVAAMFPLPVVAQSNRPSAEAVAGAVAKSRAAYAAKHPAMTQEQAIQETQKDLSRARSDVAIARRSGDRQSRAAAIQAANARVKELADKLSAVRKSYTPETVTRLMPLTFKDIAIGSVGRINDDDDQRHVVCVQIIDATQMLACIQSYSQVGVSTNRRSGTKRTESPAFLLKGRDTSDVSEDRQMKGAHDVVVTGQYTYEDTEGASHTVFVFEVFDPDKPFE